MKTNIFFYTALFLILSITACHKSKEGTQDPCSSSTVIPWTLNGRFNINDTALYNMTYDTSGSNAIINLWGYFQDPCNRINATADIHIVGNITTYAAKVYMGYCSGIPDEEISAPLVWSGHWYDRHGIMKINIKNCTSTLTSKVWIRTKYTFRTQGSRYNDLQVLSSISEALYYTITYSN